MIEYRVGNILDVTEGIIVHQVNCQGVMGSGLAKQIRDKYPIVYDRYKEFCDGNKNLLGRTCSVWIKDLCIVNLFGQEFYGRDIYNRYTSYDALARGFSDLDVRFNLNHHFHLPRIGCGLGGAEWSVVEAIIKTYFAYGDARKVTVWDLPK